MFTQYVLTSRRLISQFVLGKRVEYGEERVKFRGGGGME